MTDAALYHRFDAPARTAKIDLPKPVPFAAPILMTDIATPLVGETVLSLLWKRSAETDGP